eukprot:SAG11_NODE_10098_length_855_cov_1.074074_2_plen_44_part_01
MDPAPPNPAIMTTQVDVSETAGAMRLKAFQYTKGWWGQKGSRWH